MPGCSTGRNIQKFKGSGASTLQDALENGNTATIDIVLDNAISMAMEVVYRIYRVLVVL